MVLTPPPVDEDALGQALRRGARRCGSTSGLLAKDEAAQNALACARYAANPTGVPDRQYVVCVLNTMFIDGSRIDVC